MMMSNNHSIYGSVSSATQTSPPPPPPAGRHRSPAAMMSHEDSFHPGVAVIIGILCTMFSLTFLILLYTKHCRPASDRMPAPQPTSDPDSDAEAPPSMSARHNNLVLQQQLLMDIDALLPPIPFHALLSARQEEEEFEEFEEKEGLLVMMECAVCLTRFQSSDTLRLLPSCSHAFHAACLDTWLLSSTTTSTSATNSNAAANNNNTNTTDTNIITSSNASVLQYSTCPLCRRLAIPPSAFLLRPPSAQSPFRRHSDAAAASISSSAAHSPVDRSVRHLVDIDIHPSSAAAALPGSWHRSALDLFHGLSRRRTPLPGGSRSSPATSSPSQQQQQHLEGGIGGSGGSGSPFQPPPKYGSGHIISPVTDHDIGIAAGSKTPSPAAATYGSSGSAASINAGFRLSPPDFYTSPDVQQRRGKQSGGGSNRSSPSALAMLQSRMRRSPREGMMMMMGGDGGWNSKVRCCRSVEVADMEMAAEAAELRRLQRKAAELRCLSEITGIERRPASEFPAGSHGRRSLAASPTL